MRLLKAFIRVRCVDTVVRALQKAGAASHDLPRRHF